MSVPVLNGASPYSDADGGNGGDDVGVVEKWEMPEAAEPTPENIERIKKAVAKPEWRKHVLSPMWVGEAIAPILGLDPEADKDQIKQVIRKLISQKVLKTIPGWTATRKPCLFVVSSDWSAPVPPTGAE